MIKNTPFGDPINIQPVFMGINYITAENSGGLRINQHAAEFYLSEAARKHATLKMDESDLETFYYFKEGPDVLIPMYDNKDIRHLLISDVPAFNTFKSKSAAEVEAYLHKSLSFYHTSYLQERDIAPDPEQVKKAELQAEHYRKVRDRSPEVMIFHYDSTRTFVRDVCLVMSGDRAKHFVSEQSYEEMIMDPMQSVSKPMRALETVDMSQFPPLADRFVPYIKSYEGVYTDITVEEVAAAGLSTEEDIREVQMTLRKSFNDFMIRARTGFIASLMAENNLSSQQANQVYLNKLKELQPQLNSLLQSAPVFNELAVARKPQLSPTL